MNIVCISDTHGHHKKFDIPDGDILIHAGDFTRSGAMHEACAFDHWLSSLPHKHKVVIAGNHDKCMTLGFAKSIFEHAAYLEDSMVEIEGLRIYGTPWTPPFLNWHFMADAKSMENIHSNIPDQLDVIVSHGPSIFVGDLTEENQHVGCDSLEKVLWRVKPKLHVFGHIHSGFGRYDLEDTVCVNAALCDERNSPKNEAIVVNI